MPLPPGQTLRFRGRQRIILRRIIKVVRQVTSNNVRYPAGKRNHLLDVSTLAALGQVFLKATQSLGETWPPPPP
jgi:hypothetical protein